MFLSYFQTLKNYNTVKYILSGHRKVMYNEEQEYTQLNQTRYHSFETKTFTGNHCFWIAFYSTSNKNQICHALNVNLDNA